VSGDWIVRLPTWLGDTVMSVPFLRALRRAHDGGLLLWGPSAYAGLLAAAGLEFDFLPYRRRPGLAGTSDAIRAVAALRHRRASMAILLPNAFESALLTSIAGVPRRVGYATDGRSRLLTDAVPTPAVGNRPHEADRFAGLLEYLGIDPPRSGDDALRATPESLDRARRVAPEGEHLIGIVAGSANAPSKRWPASAYAELANEANRRWGARTALLGSAADAPIVEAVGRAVDSDALDFTGCDIEELTAVLLRCRAVVSNDTGAAHLAAALGRPTAVIFGPTDPRRSCPRGEMVTAIQSDRFCQPCEAAQCPLDHSCMAGLEPARLIEAIEPLWQAGA